MLIKCFYVLQPPKQEYCNTRPCHGGDHSHAISLHHKERRHKEHHKEHKEYKEHRVYKERHSPHKRKGLPLWAIMMISLVTVSAAAGLAFGAYVMYRRSVSPTLSSPSSITMLNFARVNRYQKATRTSDGIDNDQAL